MVAFRRRRARARRPPQAMIRPGNPAPTIGPGTAEMAIFWVPVQPSVHTGATICNTAVIEYGSTTPERGADPSVTLVQIGHGPVNDKPAAVSGVVVPKTALFALK